MVYLSGLGEVAGGLGVLVPGLRRYRRVWIDRPPHSRLSRKYSHGFEPYFAHGRDSPRLASLAAPPFASALDRMGMVLCIKTGGYSTSRASHNKIVTQPG